MRHLSCGAVAEWSKAHAWKVCMGQKLIVGSNPTRSAIYIIDFSLFFTDREKCRYRFETGPNIPCYE